MVHHRNPDEMKSHVRQLGVLPATGGRPFERVAIVKLTMTSISKDGVMSEVTVEVSPLTSRVVKSTIPASLFNFARRRCSGDKFEFELESGVSDCVVWVMGRSGRVLPLLSIKEGVGFELVVLDTLSLSRFRSEWGAFKLSTSVR